MSLEEIATMDRQIDSYLKQYQAELLALGLDMGGHCLRTSIALAPQIERLVARRPALHGQTVDIEVGNWGKAGRWSWSENAFKNLTASRSLLAKEDYHAWISVGDIIIDLTALYSLADNEEEKQLARPIYFDKRTRSIHPSGLDFNYDARLRIHWRNLVAILMKPYYLKYLSPFSIRRKNTGCCEVGSGRFGPIDKID